jgi:hypothetical protein
VPKSFVNARLPGGLTYLTQLSHTYIHPQDGCKRSAVQFKVLTISCKLQEVSNMVQVVQKMVQDVGNKVHPSLSRNPAAFKLAATAHERGKTSKKAHFRPGLVCAACTSNAYNSIPIILGYGGIDLLPEWVRVPHHGASGNDHCKLAVPSRTIFPRVWGLMIRYLYFLLPYTQDEVRAQDLGASSPNSSESPCGQLYGCGVHDAPSWTGGLGCI